MGGEAKREVRGQTGEGEWSRKRKARIGICYPMLTWTSSLPKKRLVVGVFIGFHVLIVVLPIRYQLRTKESGENVDAFEEVLGKCSFSLRTCW